MSLSLVFFWVLWFSPEKIAQPSLGDYLQFASGACFFFCFSVFNFFFSFSSFIFFFCRCNFFRGYLRSNGIFFGAHLFTRWGSGRSPILPYTDDLKRAFTSQVCLEQAVSTHPSHSCTLFPQIKHSRVSGADSDWAGA